MFQVWLCCRTQLRTSFRLQASHIAPQRIRRRQLQTKGPSTNASANVENLNVEHASQISDLSSAENFGPDEAGKPTLAEETKEVRQGAVDGVLRGKLLPTASHLFKLVLPLPEKPFAGDSSDTHSQNDSTSSPLPSSSSPSPNYPPTIFLLHPSQPLSHISRLITASFPSSNPRISFQSSFTPSRDKLKNSNPGLIQGGDGDDPIVTRKPSNNGGLQWSDSTDIGDFVKEAAMDTEFLIVVKPENKETNNSSTGHGLAKRKGYNSNSGPLAHTEERGQQHITIRVQVPSFGDRTRFLRARLETVTRDIGDMEKLKKMCDREAHQGARRVALSGFAALIAYWGAVARLTFWDVGWDVMEPVTYLSGLSTVICGYLWFLYQGREVSYSSVLTTSILSRKQALYTARGFDLSKWTERLEERNTLRREIQKIAIDYDVGWKEGDKIEDEEDEEKNEDTENVSVAAKKDHTSQKAKALMSDS